MSTVGIIHSHLTGPEYEPIQLNSGEKLILEREPENRNDANAIKVMNGGGRIGYLNRQDAVWLAPLMDGWLVELKVTPLRCGHDVGIPVELIVKTTSRGEAMLSPNRGDSPQAVLHNSMLTVYFNLEGYSKETLKKVLSQYSSVTCEVKMLPATLLILNIITTRMKELEYSLAPAVNDRLMHVSPYKTIK
ncbi:MAG: HIRAN domain-containing protein [Victivallales bacterium]